MLVLENILANVKLPDTAREHLNPDAFSLGKEISFITVKAVFSHDMKLKKAHYCFLKPSSVTCQALARHRSNGSLFECKQPAQC